LTTPGDAPALSVSKGALDVSSIGERGLIDRIRRRLPPPPASLIVSIGDDAAVTEVDRGALQVLTTDALVEGIHFDRRFSSASDIGYKALAVNVSDVAAMGAKPRLALLSLILPEHTGVETIDGILDGLLEVATATGVVVAGGNITRSPGPLIVDVTVTGAIKRRRILTRGGGRPGDRLYVSGSVGAAVAGLEWLTEHARNAGASADRLTPDDPELAQCVARHRRPEPRARVGALLGRTRAASACMDLSDGLADAVRQIAAASGTGARLDATALPIHPGAARWFTSRGRDPVDASLSGGDDYELLCAVSRKSRGRLRLVDRQARGVPLTLIGELTADRTLTVTRGDSSNPLPAGFVHF
jgi:thiamine-monophosphate kinase